MTRSTTSCVLSAKIAKQQTLLEQAGLLRQRQVFNAEQGLNFSSNDYLGLSVAPEMVAALQHGAQAYGVGSGASPLVTGYSDVHQQLESALCQQTGHEAALLFCSGYAANSALMKTLFDLNDTVIADKLVHASIIDGLKDSGCRFKRFLHNDMLSAEQHLKKWQPSALITESVFSMDGDCAPIDELSSLCQQHNTWLIVDDAHGFGVSQKGLTAETVDVQIVTFGKALGCQGAAILGSQALIDFLVANARHYIYSTSLSPSSAAVALKAVQSVDAENPSHIQRLRGLTENIQLFRRYCTEQSIALSSSQTAIQPVIIGDSQTTLTVANELKNKGFIVGAIRPPTVPKNSARLRITLTSLHTKRDIHALVLALAASLKVNVKS